MDVAPFQGRCGPNQGSVIVQITDICPECGKDHIDIQVSSNKLGLCCPMLPDAMGVAGCSTRFAEGLGICCVLCTVAASCQVSVFQCCNNASQLCPVCCTAELLTGV